MNSFWIWQKWLLLVSAAVTAFGLVLAFASKSGTLDIFMAYIDPVFWGQVGPPPQAAAFQRWVYGAWGATVAGWGLTIFFMSAVAFARRETWARNTLALALVVWFAVDTFFSVFHGVWINAALNLALLVAMGAPIFFTWHGFGRKTEPTS